MSNLPTPAEMLADATRAEPETRTFEVSITNTFDASSPHDAVEQMIEWLTVHGGATEGAFFVREPGQDEGVFVDADTDLWPGTADATL